MRTLLLADDSITVQRVIALTFAAEKTIQVITVGDGQQATEKMAALRPDIVLAATTLPQISGYDLAKFMRGDAGLQRVPVLLLSGAFETVDEGRLASCGAIGVLEKPIEPTAVIKRVKDLLGLNSDQTPATPSRLITPTGPAEKKLPSATSPRAATAPRDTTSKERQPVAEPQRQSSDYGDGLDAAFDHLDSHLSGRMPATKTARNPSGPIGQSAGAADPRSPGRAPAPVGGSGNPVFEVDDDWFGSAESQARADARAGRREFVEDLRDPELQQAAPAAPAGTVFEVDDDWFAEDDKARAAQQLAREQLAKEMGIHDVELPEAAAPPVAPAAASDLDFEFGIEDFLAKTAPEQPAAPGASPTPAPVPEPVKLASIAPLPAVAPSRSPEAPEALQAPKAPATRVAADFVQLLAFEQGERNEPPAPPQPEIRVVAPEVTDAMLDQIAARVTDRLTASAFGDQLSSSIVAAMQDSVRSQVFEASERLVRDAVSMVVSKTSERLVRDAAPAVVAETTERLVRETAAGVVAETSERVVRDLVQTVVWEASQRVVRESVPTVVWEASDRLVRESVPGVVAEASERVVRETVPNVVAETSERHVRDSVQAAVSEASERLVRDSVQVAVSEASERLVRDSVQMSVAEASERLVRDRVQGIVSETSERLVRETVRAVVSETSERLVREEIDRIKAKTRT
jgi:DNA-binding response OmpR family regulator